MKRIILASASPRRKELLEQIGIEFEVQVSNKEEVYKSSKPEGIVRELALMKAENVSEEMEIESRRNALVIGADTVVVLDEEILGKPKDKKDAYRMLHSLQGRTHQVYTGVAILDYDEKGRVYKANKAVETKVCVHTVSDDEIWEYIESGEPMDKAGAYGIQGRFAAYIDGIEGDYYNVVGLPVSYVYQELRSRSGGAWNEENRSV